MSENLLIAKEPSYRERVPVESEVAGPIPVIPVSDIRFPGADLASPRYHSLIRYEQIPSGVHVQPELAFLILPGLSSPRLEFHLSIEDRRPDIRFEVEESDPTRVRVENLKNSSDLSGLQEAVIVPGTNDRQCKIVWNQLHAGPNPCNPLRVFCTKDGRVDPVELAEGGIYLTILAPLALTTPPTQGVFPPIPSNAKPLQIKAINVSQGRVEYDLFHYAGIPQDIELEPSFRVRRGQNLALDIVISMDIYRFQQDRRSANNDQVVVDTFPEMPRPKELFRTEEADHFKACRLFWHRPLQDGLPDDVGSVRNFGLGVELEGGVFRAGWPKTLIFDPTVVQPPACTPQGVCS